VWVKDDSTLQGPGPCSFRNGQEVRGGWSDHFFEEERRGGKRKKKKEKEEKEGGGGEGRKKGKKKKKWKKRKGRKKERKGERKKRGKEKKKEKEKKKKRLMPRGYIIASGRETGEGAKRKKETLEKKAVGEEKSLNGKGKRERKQKKKKKKRALQERESGYCQRSREGRKRGGAKEMPCNCHSRWEEKELLYWRTFHETIKIDRTEALIRKEEKRYQVGHGARRKFHHKTKRQVGRGASLTTSPTGYTWSNKKNEKKPIHPKE